MTTTTENRLTLSEAMMLAAQLQSENKLPRAEEVLKRILKVNPKHAHALHLLGVIAHQVGKISLGIQLIEQAIASDARVALFHTNLGEMYRQTKEVALAIQHGRQAVKLDSKLASAHANLGIAYFDEKKYDQAETCHKKALALSPKLVTSLNNMGSIYKERKDNEMAMRFYQEAISADPQNPEPLNNLGAVYLCDLYFEKAREVITEALRLSPNFPDAHCNLGCVFNGIEDYHKAELHFQRALQYKPDYPQAYIGLGRVQRGLHHFAAAVKFTKRAIELDPSKAEFYELLAVIYSEMGDSQQAMSYYEQAFKLDPESSGALLGKGQLLIELGEAEEAKVFFSKARVAPSWQTQIAACFSLVQLSKVKMEDPLFNTLLSYDFKDLAPKQQLALHFSLGKCYNDTGDPAKAFLHYQQGCQLKRQSICYDGEEQKQLADRIIACFTKESMTSLRESANPSKLPIFVLGMPRSGTTLTEQIIASHPLVFGAGELRHLSSLVNRPVETLNGQKNYPESLFYLSNRGRRAIADDYLRELQHYAPTSQHITDKMPGNFWWIGLIHALMPGAKIIHVQRNPLDNCLSCFTRLFQDGQSFSYDLIELAHYYKTYQRVMAHWRDILPPGAFIDVQYEDLVEDLESEARRLLAYCNLEWDPICLSFHTMKRQVRTASLTQVRQPIYTSSVGGWRQFEKELQPLIKALSLESPIAL